MDCATTCGPEGIPEIKRSEHVDVSLKITELARTQLDAVFSDSPDDSILMVGVLSGGCSGYSYDLQIMGSPKEGNFQHIDVNGIPVVIHNDDSSLLDGIEIDFEKSLMGGGFKINNPNAMQSCGCGMSFG
mgnify:CR=1 FL=1